MPPNPPMTRPHSPESRPLPRTVLVWIGLVIGLVAIMVVLGGVTRLTQSGLSMVDWNPFFEFPPLTESAWQDAFNAYRQYPEYQFLNYGMSLGEFRFIFLMEYTHRMWGRLIGLVFLIPFAWFLISGALRGRRAWQLAGILGLGIVQAGLGWFMVQSGLVDEPRVSPYRLTAHLGLAILIGALLLWILLREIALARAAAGTAQPSSPAAAARIRPHAVAILVLVSLTLLSGGFVAGHDAGLTYNTFPLMDGALVPPGFLDMQPLWRNAFENIPTVQFNHRWLGIGTMIAIVALWWRAQPLALGPQARHALNGLAIMGLVQPLLGITTLLLMVPVPIAALHQAGALILLGCALWTLSELIHVRPVRRDGPALDSARTAV